MIYLIHKFPANTTTCYDYDTWCVMKVTQDNMEYPVATFRSEQQARWCLSSLLHSIEAPRDDCMVFDEVLCW